LPASMTIDAPTLLTRLLTAILEMNIELE